MTTKTTNQRFGSSICCIGFSFPKAVLRTVKNRIDRWLTVHAQSDASPDYRLVLQREGNAPICLAKLEVRIGSRMLHATSYARDGQAAVSRCLNEILGFLKGPGAHSQASPLL